MRANSTLIVVSWGLNQPMKNNRKSQKRDITLVNELYLSLFTGC